VLYSFAGPAPGEWLDSHPDHYAVSVKLALSPAEYPHHPDGTLDFEGIADRVAALGDLPPAERFPHRTSCPVLRTLDDLYQVTTGSQDELGQQFRDEDTPEPCPACA
jgi:hypothetical protein